MGRIMKHFIKLGVLGLAMSMTACTYNNQEELLTVKGNTKNIALVLGDTRTSYIYNMKKPQDVFLYAPIGYQIVIGDERHEYYKKHINPQEMINLKFTIVKEGEDIKNAKEIEKFVFTFKEDYKPSNQVYMYKRSGKSNYKAGDINYFRAAENQKEILVELHEYNNEIVHIFDYSGVKTDIRFKLIAPKYHSFVFNGKVKKEYSFTMPKDSEKAFSMTLKPDWAKEEQTYQRQYHFSLKNKR